MAYPITRAHIAGLPQQPYRHGIGAYEMVVGHATADNGATDENELTFFTREWAKLQAFPHTFTDWDSITELADPKYKAWGAGNANPRAVHVELCQTKDPAKFRASYARWVWVIAYYLFQRKLGVRDGVTLVSHDWVSKNLGGTNHSDPIEYLKTWGVSWAQVVKDVAAAYATMEPATATTTKGAASVITAKEIFSDIQGNWAHDTILKAKELGLMNGYPDGTFKPNQPVTRAEMAAILVRLSQK